MQRTGGFCSNSSRRYNTTNTMQIRNEPTYHLLGVPLRTGSLYPGSEIDAQAYRDAHLLRSKTGLDRVLPGTVSASVSPVIYSSRGISLCSSVLTAASW